MNWPRLAQILRESPLDHETKFMIIDLIASTDDKKLEEETLQLVFDWDEVDKEGFRIFQEGMKKILTDYEERQDSLRRSVQAQSLSIADELASQQKIQQIREHIQSL